MKTPALKSRFCDLHKPRACLTQSTDTLAEPPNEEESGKESREGGESGTVVQLVIAKRLTRSGAHYQVIKITYINVCYTFMYCIVDT